MKEHAPPRHAKAARQGGFASQSDDKARLQAESVRTSRKRPHGGFFRVSEDAVRHIELAFEEPCHHRAALLCYVTLCRKANLRGSETYEDTIASLAADMGYAYRDAQKALRLVEGIGLVRVHRRKIPGTKAHAPSIYTIKTFFPLVIRFGEHGVHATLPQHSQELPQEIHTYIPKEGGK